MHPVSHVRLHELLESTMKISVDPDSPATQRQLILHFGPGHVELLLNVNMVPGQVSEVFEVLDCLFLFAPSQEPGWRLSDKDGSDSEKTNRDELNGHRDSPCSVARRSQVLIHPVIDLILSLGRVRK